MGDLNGTAFIVYSESGEYSDHRFRVLAVALTESEARAACEREARRIAAEETGAGSDTVVVRPTRSHDYDHHDGAWAVVRRYGWDEDVNKDLDAYNGEFIGFHPATLFRKEATDV